MARIDGLDGDDREGQIEAAQELLLDNRISDAEIQVAGHTGADGILILRTAVDTPLAVITGELQGVPGFRYVEDYLSDDFDWQAGDSGGEEEEGLVDAPPDPFTLDSGPVGEGGADLNVGLVGNEPTIAVNPLNPNNVVVAQYNNGLESMKFSLDGGATFPIQRNAVLPSGQTFFSGDDSVAFDAQGRLFWTYLTGPNGANVVSLQVNPTTGAVIGTPSFVALGPNLDKEWLAADASPSSPFANNLYAVWHDFGQSNAPVRFARSTNQGATWTTLAGNLSAANEGFTWPSEVSVAPNGDVWVAWHANTGDTTGSVRMRRSTDGGLTFGPEIVPFPAGTAATTYNSDAALANKINGIHVWLQGSMQPRILTDPLRPGNLYVVSVDDPDAFNPLNDPSDIVIARSTNNGATWTRTTISQGLNGDTEIMPAAAIDPSGNIAVTWYDNRRHQTVPDSLGGTHYLLDLYATTSTDGGLTFTAPVQVNDPANPFDPERGAPDRFSPNHVLRIGEYNGLASAGGFAFAVWTGNSASGQQVQFDKFQLGFAVTASTPANGSVVTTPPASYVISFTDPVDPSSLQPGDLKVNSTPADGVTLSADLKTATFTFSVNPVASQGLQSIDIAAGSITKQGSPAAGILAFHADFRYDAVLLQVTSTVPPTPNGVFTLPAPLTYDVTFNEPVAPGSVQASDLVLTGLAGATVTGAAVLPGNTTVRFTIGGVTAEGALSASIAAGAITDQFGNPGLGFSATYAVDFGTVAFPVPLAAGPPTGSLIYSGTATGGIGPVGDTDAFTITLDPGQTIVVLVTPTASGLRPTVQLLDPSSAAIGSATAAATGQNALIQATAVSVAGTYTLVVGGAGSTTGGYTVQVILNAALEAEGNLAGVDNNSRATAQPLDASFLGLPATDAGVSRGAVVGANPVGFATALATDFEGGPAGFTVNNNIRGTGASAGLWHLSTRRGTQAGHSPITSFYYGGEATGTYDTGAANSGSITSPVITLAPGAATLSFNYVLQTEATTGFDTANVQVSTNGFATFTPVGSRATNLPNSATWAPFTADLSAFAGQSIQIRWIFDTIDSVSNAFEGWYVDDVQVGAATSWDDFYSVTLNAGDVVSVGLNNLTGTGTEVALLDTAGNTLATGIAGPTNLGRVISNLPIVLNATTYYLRVTGQAAATYDLVVTRNAALDTEGNGSFAAAQPVDGSRGALGALGGSATTLTFDELPTQPVNGLTFQGVTFGYTVSGVASTDARYDAAGPGITAFTQDPALEGGTAGVLTLNFATPTSTLQFGLGSSSTAAIANAATVSLFGANAALIGTFTIAVSPLGFTFASGQFTYGGSTPVARAVLTFNSTAAARFIVDNLAYSTLDEDWYTVNLTSTANFLTLSTATPAGGPGQFVNNLTPRIELYNSSNALVAVGSVGPDGRNQVLQYLAAVPGAYRIRVVGVGSSIGEYFLGVRTEGRSPDASLASVLGVTVDNGTAQRSRVRSITVDLNGTIASAPSSAFLLVRTGDGLSIPVVASSPTPLPGGRTRIVLTFAGSSLDAGSLPDGFYALTIDGRQMLDGSGRGVDAGNVGTAGSVGLVNFHRFFGDANGDAIVDASDFLAFRAAYLGGDASGFNSAFDRDGDAAFIPIDLAAFTDNFRKRRLT